MNRHHRQISTFSAGARALLPAVALAALLGACGKQDNIPVPPSSPPRPITSAAQIGTADLMIRHACPRPSSHTMM